MSDLIQLYQRFVKKKKYLQKRHFLFCFLVEFAVGGFIIICNLLCFTIKNQNLKNDAFLSQAWNITKGSEEEKPSDDVNDELLDLIISINKKDTSRLENEVRNVKDPKKAVAVTKQYEKIQMGKKKDHKHCLEASTAFKVV